MRETFSGQSVYDWNQRRRLDDWKLEGHGELLAADDGALHVRTCNHGPLRRATDAWLREVELPAAFEVEWDYRNFGGYIDSFYRNLVVRKSG